MNLQIRNIIFKKFTGLKPGEQLKRMSNCALVLDSFMCKTTMHDVMMTSQFWYIYDLTQRKLCTIKRKENEKCCSKYEN